ncbi:MAG: FAD-binding oxidoreductase, partial [Pseudomonas sp.]
IESTEITSFYLAPVDGGAVMAHLPGQFIGLRIVVDGKEQRRNYSLSALANGRELRISVKREAAGVVSRHLHDAVREGDVLEIFPPAGHFTLAESDKPLVLVSGGVGITPTLPMLAAALGSARPVVFIHCARTPEVQGFRARIDELALKHPQLQCHYLYENAAPARIDAEQLGRW